jgi:hypothetical protein
MSSNPRASDRKARPKSLRGRNSVLHSYIVTESDRSGLPTPERAAGQQKGTRLGITMHEDLAVFRQPRIPHPTLHRDVKRRYSERVRPRTASSAHLWPMLSNKLLATKTSYLERRADEAPERRPSIGCRRAYTSYGPPTYL